MRIAYDANKRAKTLRERGLDFDDVPTVLAGRSFTLRDDRRDYGEERFLSFGLLDERQIAVVWTPRGNAVHIISMRKANEREKRRFGVRMD